MTLTLNYTCSMATGLSTSGFWLSPVDIIFLETLRWNQHQCLRLSMYGRALRFEEGTCDIENWKNGNGRRWSRFGSGRKQKFTAMLTIQSSLSKTLLSIYISKMESYLPWRSSGTKRRFKARRRNSSFQRMKTLRSFTRWSN